MAWQSSMGVIALSAAGERQPQLRDRGTGLACRVSSLLFFGLAPAPACERAPTHITMIARRCQGLCRIATKWSPLRQHNRLSEKRTR